jgi:sulfide:quinone oxidoreductase
MPIERPTASDSASTTYAHRVIVAGGGVAGLEAVLALHAQAGDRVEITLLEPSIELVDRPMLVARPFAAGQADRTPIARILAPTRAIHRRERLESVDADAQTVRTDTGEELHYDSLIIALGARPVPADVHPWTFSPADPDAIAGLLRDLEEGYSTSVAFVIPSGPVWPFPAYELALLTAHEARGMGQDTSVTIVTPEERPLDAFGRTASDAVAALLRDHHIDLITSARAEPATDSSGLVIRPGDRHLDVERIFAVPRLEGQAIRGLPHDAEGFLEIDPHCAVRGVPGVYAAGDGANFSVKHGGLAAEMADTAAEHIAARAGADIEPQPFTPILRGKLLTGGRSRSLRGGAVRSAAADHMLWWPPAKVAARHLAPALAGEVGEELLDIEPGPDALSVRHVLDERLRQPAG